MTDHTIGQQHQILSKPTEYENDHAWMIYSGHTNLYYNGSLANNLHEKNWVCYVFIASYTKFNCVSDLLRCTEINSALRKMTVYKPRKS